VGEWGIRGDKGEFASISSPTLPLLPKGISAHLILKEKF
jgi:hypothetical protein